MSARARAITTSRRLSPRTGYEVVQGRASTRSLSEVTAPLVSRRLTMSRRQAPQVACRSTHHSEERPAPAREGCRFGADTAPDMGVAGNLGRSSGPGVLVVAAGAGCGHPAAGGSSPAAAGAGRPRAAGGGYAGRRRRAARRSGPGDEAAAMAAGRCNWVGPDRSLVAAHHGRGGGRLGPSVGILVDCLTRLVCLPADPQVRRKSPSG